MLRNIRITAPVERYDDLRAASAHTGLPQGWHCIDDDPDARWPYAGDGRAVVLLVVDDSHESTADVLAAVRNAHTLLTGEDAHFVEVGGSYVYWPDGCSIETYRYLDGPTVALHAAEERANRPEAAAEDLAEVLRLRDELSIPLAQAIEFGELAVSEFMEAMAEHGILPSE